MNNSKLVNDSIESFREETVDRTPFLREREGKLITILAALREVSETKAWSSLKIEVFDGLVESLNKDISHEAKREVPNALKLNRLSGELKWAEKYSDLSKLELVFRVELAGIRKQLYGKTQEITGTSGGSSY